MFKKGVAVKIYKAFKLFFLYLLVFSDSLQASAWTSWTEEPSNPIFNPYPSASLPEDSFPYIVYDKKQFQDDGDQFYYKMWHQGSNANGSIAISYSNDGISWTLQGETNLTPAYHPVVLYDKNGFGVSGKPYRIWYWTGNPSSTYVGVIQFSQSSDGITWDSPQSITQDSNFPLVTGSDFFFQLYGPGFVIYNNAPTSISGQPYTFPYVMFYDIATSTQTFQAESIGLAYSNDGLNWTRYGFQPILIPSGAVATDWDATHLYRPSVFKYKKTYHMFYSGSNQYVDPLTTVVYAHGLGHASSKDGVNWVKDAENPIFIYSDGVAWRNSRTYTPFVLFGKFCDANNCVNKIGKMWFVGGTGTTPGQNQGIGYATLINPKLN